MYRGRVFPCVVCAGRAAFFFHRIGLALVASNNGDRVTCSRVGSRRRGRLEHKALPSLTRHLLHVILMAIEFCGHVVV